MDSKRELFEYYDARAPEYEEFYDGGRPARFPDPVLVGKEIAMLKKLLPDYVNGKCIDIACGTGFWLPFYERNCTGITLIDQSKNVLTECIKKVEKLGIEHKTEILCHDIFNYPFVEQAHNSVVIAFLISHLTNDELDALFTLLKRILTTSAKFVIMDKVWNETTATIRGVKAGMVTRTIKDGRQFEILNRYFERFDLEDMAKRHVFNLDIVYWGNIVFFATGCFD